MAWRYRQHRCEAFGCMLQATVGNYCVIHDPERVWMRGGREIYAEQIEAGEWTKDDLFRISFKGETILTPCDFSTAWRFLFEKGHPEGMFIHPVTPDMAATVLQ